eukprot:NODE_234_length_12000_cov_0.516343.p5 type:complete len:227 gc:universal NODE_234_length_12000_cov_0.516343:9461-10141(+)
MKRRLFINNFCRSCACFIGFNAFFICLLSIYLNGCTKTNAWLLICSIFTIFAYIEYSDVYLQNKIATDQILWLEIVMDICLSAFESMTTTYPLVRFMRQKGDLGYIVALSTCMFVVLFARLLHYDQLLNYEDWVIYMIYCVIGICCFVSDLAYIKVILLIHSNKIAKHDRKQMNVLRVCYVLMTLAIVIQTISIGLSMYQKTTVFLGVSLVILIYLGIKWHFDRFW